MHLVGILFPHKTAFSTASPKVNHLPASQHISGLRCKPPLPLRRQDSNSSSELLRQLNYTDTSSVHRLTSVTHPCYPTSKKIFSTPPPAVTSTTYRNTGSRPHRPHLRRRMHTLSYVYFHLMCICVMLCVFVVTYVYFLCYVCVAVLTLDAGLLARSQYPEGPATGHLDTGFSWFPCVYKRMLR